MHNTTYELTTPIEAHGETITTLSLRHLTAGLMRKIKGNPTVDLFEMTAVFLELCGDLPPTAVDQISPFDLLKSSEIFLGFLGDSQPTGKK